MQFVGNWLDLVIVICFLLYLWEGWRRGAIETTIEFVAFIGGFISGILLYRFTAGFLADFFTLPTALGNGLSLLGTSIIAEQLLVGLLAKLLEYLPKHWLRHPINVGATVIPLVANAVILATLLVTALLNIPLNTGFKHGLQYSTVTQYLSLSSQRVEQLLSALLNISDVSTVNFRTTSDMQSFSLNFTETSVTTDEVGETHVLRLINKERVSLGLDPLEIDTRLRDLSREYGIEIFRSGHFSHIDLSGRTTFDRMKLAGIVYLTAGENLAFAPNVVVAHSGLMQSVTHRENILSPQFKKVGIGVIDGGRYGKMIVEEFTN